MTATSLARLTFAALAASKESGEYAAAWAGWSRVSAG